MALPVRKHWALVNCIRAEIRELEAAILQTDAYLAGWVPTQAHRRKRLAELRGALEKAEKEK